MSSPKPEAAEETGLGEATDRQSKCNTPEPSSSGESANTDSMKRQAARRLIERFYYQLTDGCGQSACNNPHCASNPSFVFANIGKDVLAVRAIELSKNKAILCDSSGPAKVAKEGSQGGSSSSGAVQSSSSANTSASTYAPPSATKPSATCSHSEKKAVPYLDEGKLHDIIDECKRDESWSKLIRTIGSVFNNTDSMLLSFRKSDSKMPSKEELRSMEVDQDKDKDDKEMDADVDEDSTMTEVETACDNSKRVPLRDDEVTVDLESVRRSYGELFSIPDHPFQAALINAVTTLSRDLEMDLKFKKPFEQDPNYLNIFLIVLEIPALHSPEFIEKATPLFCKATGRLPLDAQAKLVRVFAGFKHDKLKEYVDSLQQLITVKVISNRWARGSLVNDDEGITGAARVLKLLFYASVYGGDMDPPEQIEEEKLQMESAAEDSLLQGAVGHELKEKNTPKDDPLEVELRVRAIDCRHPLIPWEDFVNEPLSDQVEMDKDYSNYKSENQPARFSFMTHSFLLTTSVKTLGMYYDNRIRMMNERRASLLQSLVHGAPTNPYLRLRIRRDHIIDDALVSLEMAAMDNPQDLKKQLYVEFEGEQGIDEGGVSKEFFQLVVEEIFNPDIGMFTYNEETKDFWFNSTSFENDGQFSLIGIVLGLAIYNSIILDVHFPMVVYRKLLNKKGTFKDLKDSHPTLARGLQEMLEFEGDVENTFMQTFRISYTDVFGATLHHDLKEHGDEIVVTKENREDFVDLYSDFLLNKSIEKQFRAFKRGFQMVTDESPLRMLFRPDEIEMLVCGSKHLDFNALEEATDYDGGFTPDSTTVKHFWEIVHDFDEEKKKLLLQFTTGSDRVPIGGLAKLKLIIARNGPDSDRLPTSHTCFNVLLLPDYSSKEKLEERLLKAITHAKGFGML